MSITSLSSQKHQLTTKFFVIVLVACLLGIGLVVLLSNIHPVRVVVVNVTTILATRKSGVGTTENDEQGYYYCSDDFHLKGVCVRETLGVGHY